MIAQTFDSGLKEAPFFGSCKMLKVIGIIYLDDRM